MESDDISLVITGPGGAGVIAAGELLLKTAAQIGYYGLLKKSFGPQVRGGESSAMLRFSRKRVECLQDTVQLLLVIDWAILTPFVDELVFDENTLILCDKDSGEIPQAIIDSHATLCPLPLTELAKEMKIKINMIGVGLLANLLGLPLGNLLAVARDHFQGKDSELIDAVLLGIEAGSSYPLPAVFPSLCHLDVQAKKDWLYSGNQLLGLGALKAGIRFVAGYPITPATDLLEWLAVNIASVGGTLIQAEDELASINMVIGASYGGVPALTATSGPGLSLMSEGLGLAVAAEIPLLVVNVNRGGPSTGIPTKSEQSDLNQALYGVHGDAPHIVTAPAGIADCAFTSGWTVNLAEQLQCPAILLSDQFIGHSVVAGDKPPFFEQLAQRQTAEPDGDYRRYLDTQSGISPMAIPGMANGMYTADGLTHNEQGHPSALAQVQQQQLDKRQRKLQDYDYGQHWGEIEHSGAIKIICFGSLRAIALDALNALTKKGIEATLISLRLLAPLPVAQLQACLAGATHIIVVEQSHSGQLFHYLGSQLFNLTEFSGASYSLAKPGPVPFRSAEIVRFVEQITQPNSQGEKGHE